MNNIPVPGFKAFLERTYGKETVEQPVVQKALSIEGKLEDRTIVQIQGSSNIDVLDYNRKLKRLTTTFVSGAIHVYPDITQEEFQRVAYPGEEFDYSVGKAHYAIIRSKEKKK